MVVLIGPGKQSAEATQRWTVRIDALSLAQPLGTPLRDLTKDMVRGIRRAFRQALWLISHAVNVWGRWALRSFTFVAIALLMGLLDRNLLAAWRREGIRVVGTYVPMMLYVYLRLFFDRRVLLVSKLLLIVSVTYGVWRFDLLPDRNFIPGYLEDILLIGVAMRIFLYCSPMAAVEAYAAQAVNFRRRLAA